MEAFMTEILETIKKMVKGFIFYKMEISMKVNFMMINFMDKEKWLIKFMKVIKVMTDIGIMIYKMDMESLNSKMEIFMKENL